MLLSGRVDATLNAEVSIYDYLTVRPDAAIRIAALTDDASEVCIPLRKGEESASLKEAIDQAIMELRDEGELTKLSEQFFGSDISGAEE